jgi:hypothetical protein
VNYNNEQVGGLGGNCFLPDDDCYRSYATGNATSNELCELSVSESVLISFLFYFIVIVVGFKISSVLQVYISWIGTDADGKNFESGAYRFSRWTGAQISNYTTTLHDKKVVI